MKFFLQILLFFLLVTQIHYPQWTNQNLVPDHNDLWSTFFVDDITGWIVGSGGFIKKTTNAGNEWFQQNSGTTLILKSVQFVNQNTGWICGESGLILKSTDGGTSWDSLASGTTQHLSDIYFYDTDTGYVVGFNGTILKTINGGSSWTNLSSGTTNDLYSMDFVDAFTGYAAGEINDTSSVIKTTDGGINWSMGGNWLDKKSPCKSIIIDGGSSNNLFITNSDGIFYSADAGITWVLKNKGMNLISISVIKIIDNKIYAGIHNISLGEYNLSTQVPKWEMLPKFYTKQTIKKLISFGNTPTDMLALEGGG